MPESDPFPHIDWADPFAQVRLIDLFAPLCVVMSRRTVQRLAWRQLGARKVGRILLIPVDRIRAELGEDIAEAAVAAAEHRISSAAGRARA